MVSHIKLHMVSCRYKTSKSYCKRTSQMTSDAPNHVPSLECMFVVDFPKFEWFAQFGHESKDE